MYAIPIPSHPGCNRSFLPHHLRINVSYSGAGAYLPTFSRFRIPVYPFDDGGRTSPRAGRRAGPPRVPSRQIGTVAEEAKEKVRLESRKGPRNPESARFSPPSTARFCIQHLHLLCEACSSLKFPHCTYRQHPTQSLTMRKMRVPPMNNGMAY